MGQYTSYWLYQKYEQRGSQDPIPVYPNAYSINGDGTMTPVVRNEDDPQCGYVPPVEPTYRWTNIPITQDYICDECGIAQYRWVNLDPSVDYYCEGTTKYYKQKQQVSYDGGQTWQDVTPPVYQKGGVAESQSTDCGYVPPTPPPTSSDYLTITPKANGHIKMNNLSSGYYTDTLYYSYDDGVTWLTANSSTNISMINGQPILLKGTLHPRMNAGVGTLSADTYFEAGGNVLSLLYGDNFRDEGSLGTTDYTFQKLFYGCTNLLNIGGLVLPATTLTNQCYNGMFAGCTSLVSIPSNLLPATNLKAGCYHSMFAGCTSLVSIPSNLLPVTNVTQECYKLMFSGCTSLVSAPSLPATTLSSPYCYSYMFAGCTSLVSAPSLPATTLSVGCYDYMFSGCTSLETAPVLLAPTLTTTCYEYMFTNCTSLNKITCLAENGVGTNNRATTDWVRGVSGTGTFTKKAGVTWSSGTSGIPNGWTVVEV